MHGYMRAMQDDFSQCMVLNTRMAARAVTRHADHRLRRFGVTAAQFNILTTLNDHPDRSVTEMANSIAMERSTLSRNLDLLERKGLVAKQAAEHGNRRIVALSEAGAELVEKMLPEWRKWQAELRDTLTNPDFEGAIAALQQLAKL
ncbi:MarR family winged helix-turn-helix transcriptional regulator [Devosia epidermidihirudinis]|nr:MarR family transcriptional regulator [Devosia epidermidihirudinis]